jgi:transposase-like protein
MKKYQIVRQKGRVWEDAQLIPMRVPVQALIDGVREEVESLAMEAGIIMMEMAMEGERSRLTDGPRRRGYRWGQQKGYVVMNGRKVPIEHGRVRDLKNREIALKTYERFQSGKMKETAMREMMRGVSSRAYGEGFEALMRGYGIRRSSISRHVVEATEEKLRALMERDLKLLDLTCVFIDGVHFAETLLVVAIGVDVKGNKHALGIWQGATENATVCKELVKDLIGRGLDAERKYLFILDGGKGLRSAIEEVFGERAEVQRCQEHKKRNVAAHLPERYQIEIRQRMNEAYATKDYEHAKSALESCVRDLRKINPSAARSLEEGLEETLTLHRLELPMALRVSLSTTNVIESGLFMIRHKCQRVMRWRDGDHVQRWTAAALLEAESKSWRKIKGYTLMDKLLSALGREDTKNIQRISEVSRIEKNRMSGNLEPVFMSPA